MEGSREQGGVVVRQLSPERRPPWSDVTSAGVFRVAADGSFDRHYHDCHEYWLVFGGRARIAVGDAEYLVEKGDIVCIEAGVDHDVLAVDGALEAFWFEAATPPGGRVGHLHRTPEDAARHRVAALERG